MVTVDANPGDTIEVEFDVENTGGLDGDQDIVLTRENGDKVSIDEIEGLELEVDESDSGTLTWDIPDDQEEEVLDLCVESDDSKDCIFDPFGEFDATDVTGVTEVWDGPAGRQLAYTKGKIFATTEEEIKALSATDGSVVWSETYEGFKAVSGIAAADGKVVYYRNPEDGGERQVVAVDHRDNSEIWSREWVSGSDSDIPVEFAYDSGRVALVGDRDVIVLDIEDGSIIFEEENSYIWQSVGFSGDLVALFSTEDLVQTYDIDDDSLLWDVEKSANSVAMYVDQDGVYALNGDLTKYDRSDGSEDYNVGSSGSPGDLYGGDGVVYAISSGAIYAHDADNGDEIWSTSDYGEGDDQCKMAVNADDLYTPTGNTGTTYRLELDY